MPDNSPIFEEQTLTSDMSNFLEEWGLPLEGDIQESFKPEAPPSAMQQLEEMQPSPDMSSEQRMLALEELQPSPTMTREQGIQELTQMQQSEGYVPASVEEPAPTQYTVEEGDTLSQLAQGFGLDMNQLAELNQIQDPNKIQVGQILNLVGLGDQKQPATEPIMRTAPHQIGVGEEDVLTWNASTNKFEPSKKSVERQESVLPTTALQGLEYVFSGKTMRTEKDIKADEHMLLKDLAKIAIKRGQGLLPQILTTKGEGGYSGQPQYIEGKNYLISYGDYDEIGGTQLGYKQTTSLKQLDDPAYNMKTAYGVMRLMTHKGNVYLADEQNFFDPQLKEQLRDRPVTDRISFIYNEFMEDKLSPVGFAHRIAEAFGPEMGDSISSRILIGSKKELGLSAKEFKHIPTVKEYEDFMVKTKQLHPVHPSKGWGREQGAEPQTKTKSFGDYFGGEIAVEMGELENQLSGMPKEDLMTVLSFMPIPAIAGAAVPIKAIQAWLKRHGATKYKEMGRGTQFPLGVEEKGLLPQVRDFVQSIFMQKGMEKALKKGVRYGGEAGRDFVVKGPITQKELRILTDATAKSKKKWNDTGYAALDPNNLPLLDERAKRARPIYMKFRGKDVEVDDLAQIEDDLRRQMFGEVKVGDILP